MRKTIGKMSKGRGVWQMKPVTRVAKDKTKYTRKIKHRREEDVQ